jgi:DNA-binding NtrC family response regulator
MEMTRATPDPAGESATASANPYQGLLLREARDSLEGDLIRAALVRHKGNVSRTAAELGVDRAHPHRRISALGLGEE